LTAEDLAMSAFTRLPAIVLIYIISLLDNKTIKALRLACKELSGFANRVLFRSISLYDKSDSCRLLKSVLGQPHLREEVFTLNLHTVEEDHVSLLCMKEVLNLQLLVIYLSDLITRTLMKKRKSILHGDGKRY
jgi:hypothetical protein